MCSRERERLRMCFPNNVYMVAFSDRVRHCLTFCNHLVWVLWKEQFRAHQAPLEGAKVTGHFIGILLNSGSEGPTVETVIPKKRALQVVRG